MRLADDGELERSSVVANRAMNRTRGLSGRDGYSAVLGVDILALAPASWLDLCCGSGKALLEAAGALDTVITGVDLVGFFAGPLPATVDLVAASVTGWRPDRRYDLITCVHGLHYVGDKLGLLAAAASWLMPNGLLIANFDVSSLRDQDGRPLRVTKVLREAGFQYARHRIRRQGPAEVAFGVLDLGADPKAGLNYTGQPAVHSYYSSQG
ncbi:methyltransferase domain-containing protein [Actinocrispum sp. NPDC049592]|uniref:methyltransferase domain-containing protein n=1 Tax=Actinocrispum sp. NPDC049592 TaxID=3154835 RepID=UPI003432C7AB